MAHVLEVPFLSQLDNDSSQYSKYYQECSFSCIAMLLVYLGLAKRTHTDGRQLDDFVADEYGIEYGDSQRGAPLLMAKYLKKFWDVTDYATYSGNASDIKRSLDAGLPVIVHTDLSASGHVIIIVGYDDVKQTWVVHDPFGEWHASGYDSRLSQGKFESYSYALMDRKAGPDGNWWLHIIDEAHATADVTFAPEEHIQPRADVSQATSKLLLPYDGNPDGFVQAVRDLSKHLGYDFHTNRFKLAYLLATVEHETAATFKPIDEWHGESARYAPYFGRGYVQLTWKENYQKYQDILGIPLVSQPALVKRPDISLFILLHGCHRGAFTGLRFGHFIGATRKHVDFVNARKVINGLDRAEHIAELAEDWLTKLA